jgi:dihydropteroate synthase
MGILNVTPDSFSDGGDWNSIDLAIKQGLALVEQGADILDIGGESTRPGAEPVSLEEERRRVIPVIEQLTRKCNVPISVDTSKSEIAERALAAGAQIVNDITGLTGDPEMPAVCAASSCGVIAMHMQGTPQTMQVNPHYDDVVREVPEYLGQRLAALAAAGIAADRVVLDPGIGFGKTARHNLSLLADLKSLHQLGRPLLIGHSRKRFLQKLIQRPIDERLAGTIGVAIAVAEQGAEIIRVHDVGAVRAALTAWQTVSQRPSPVDVNRMD